VRIARIAPTLAPPTWKQLGSGLLAAFRPRSHGDVLRRELETMFPSTWVVPTSSGRAALAVALRAAMRATGRRRVVLPAYTSFSVAAAAAAAGARVDLCDLDRSTLGLDRASLSECVGRDTAAVVLGNLYGYPDATADLEWLAGEGVLLVDDAAQALGATERGRPVGGRGDLGVLSFGRGKCVTLGEGGALLVGREDLRELVEAMAPRRAPRGAGAWLLAAATVPCTSQLAFGLLSRLPGLRVGESWYDPSFPVAATSAAAIGLGRDLRSAVNRQLETRRRVARRWDEVLRELPDLARIRPTSAAGPAFLRFPVLAADRAAREDLASRLARTRFTFVRSFPCALGRLEPFARQQCENRMTPFADQLADRVVALPCHHGVRDADIDRAARVLRDRALAGTASTAAPALTIPTTG
jgi:dTDP-4-amino-4,6-dideoxygalactose transaminase